MNTQLDPIVSEFETQEQADSYDRCSRPKFSAASTTRAKECLMTKL